jgi:hypothetical protein
MELAGLHSNAHGLSGFASQGIDEGQMLDWLAISSRSYGQP